NVFVPTRGSLEQTRAIVDAGPGEAIRSRHIEFAPLHACGDQHGVRGKPAAILQGSYAIRAVRLQRYRTLGRENVRAESFRLRHRTRREVGTAEAGGKSEIVFDARAQPGLAAGRIALHDHRAESLRGAVDRGCKSRRPGAQDHQVVKLLLGTSAQAD